jgi:uncharacterized metal-binding protein YceD (DUF177 family)
MGAGGQTWTVPVRLEEIPEAGRRLHLIADEGIRAAIANLAGVDGLSRLEAVFDLARSGRNGLRVSGNVSATVRQNCVVTLEPVENAVDEVVDLAFTAKPGADAAAIDIAADASEPPEILVDGMLDLGAIATEFLILGIDPYPRKPGAVFEAPARSDAGASPFAGLAALKKGERDA